MRVTVLVANLLLLFSVVCGGTAVFASAHDVEELDEFQPLAQSLRGGRRRLCSGCPDPKKACCKDQFVSTAGGDGQGQGATSGGMFVNEADPAKDQVIRDSKSAESSEDSDTGSKDNQGVASPGGKTKKSESVEENTAGEGQDDEGQQQREDAQSKADLAAWQNQMKREINEVFAKVAAQNRKDATLRDYDQKLKKLEEQIATKLQESQEAAHAQDVVRLAKAKQAIANWSREHQRVNKNKETFKKTGVSPDKDHSQKVKYMADVSGAFGQKIASKVPAEYKGTIGSTPGVVGNIAMAAGIEAFNKEFAVDEGDVYVLDNKKPKEPKVGKDAIGNVQDTGGAERQFAPEGGSTGGADDPAKDQVIGGSQSMDEGIALPSTTNGAGEGIALPSTTNGGERKLIGVGELKLVLCQAKEEAFEEAVQDLSSFQPESMTEELEVFELLNSFRCQM